MDDGVVAVEGIAAAAFAQAAALRIIGSRDMYDPNGRKDASVNFITCHDGFTLWDLYAVKADVRQAPAAVADVGPENAMLPAEADHMPEKCKHVPVLLQQRPVQPGGKPSPLPGPSPAGLPSGREA